MRAWWEGRPLRLRLTIWYTAVASGTILAMACVVYGLVEHQLHLDLDRQLRTDWNRVESQVGFLSSDRIQWYGKDIYWAGGIGKPPGWFDLWSENKQLLLHQWPGTEEQMGPPLPETESFHTFGLKDGTRVRALTQPVQSAASRRLTLRVFRDESGLDRTLREILVGFVLGVPLAALFASLGGYVMVGRALAPVSAMAEQARRITSESLSQRLPNPSPHDELGQLATVFNQTLQRLQDSFESLRRFTADASHELRTPLTALRTVGEVALRDGADPAGLRETVGSMLEEAQHINDLIDSLLLLARAEGTQAQRLLENVYLLDLLTEVRERVAVLAAEKQQTIELEGDPELCVSADHLLLRQAVMNIVHNAIRYSPPGTKVLMRCFRRDDHAVIEIADEGPGIAKEHQQRIFERFFRVDKARSRAEGGAGLGLAIARLSVEQHGGTIELVNLVGSGSRFRVVLPGLPRVG